MMTTWKKTSSETDIAKINSPANGCWVDVVDPSAEEISFVGKNLCVPRDFVSGCLDQDEVSRVEKENEMSLFIFRVPSAKSDNHSADVIPLGVVISKSMVVTIHTRETEVLSDFRDGKIKSFNTVDGVNFLLQVLKRSSHHYIRYLEKIEKEIDVLEESLLKSSRNEEIVKLLRIQKQLIYFDTGMASNSAVLEELLDGDAIDLPKADAALLNHVITENKQAMEMGNIFSNILSNTLDAYASIVSNNLNMVMKFLASFTIILSLPVIVASFYGMNVPLPLQNDPAMFLILVLASTALSLGAIHLFTRKKWF